MNYIERSLRKIVIKYNEMLLNGHTFSKLERNAFRRVENLIDNIQNDPELSGIYFIDSRWIKIN